MIRQSHGDPGAPGPGARAIPPTDDDADEPLVDLLVEAPEWDAALPELGRIATRAAELALEEVGLAPETYTLSVLACDDARIADLNESFRGKAQPTNVLSWPAFELAPAAEGERPKRPPELPVAGGRQPLGDVAIAFGTVVHEAAGRSLPLKNHVMHLILHGCLHLLGHDHERPADAALMEDLERRALAREGVPDPYE